MLGLYTDKQIQIFLSIYRYIYIYMYTKGDDEILNSSILKDCLDC